MGDSDSLTFADKAQNPDDIFLVAAHDPDGMRRQVQQCVDHKLRLVYDPGQQVNNLPGENLKAGVEAAELVLVNDYETDLLCKKTGLSETDLTATVPVLVTTLGEQGSIIRGAQVGETIQITAAKPAAVVDPTGAGDAYRAGFLYGYLRKWELRKCGQLASVVASFALEQHGPQAEFSRQTVASRYQETYNEEVNF
jgi:adenosine kinase